MTDEPIVPIEPAEASEPAIIDTSEGSSKPADGVAVAPEAAPETPEPEAEAAAEPEAAKEEPKKELDKSVWGDTGSEVGNSVLGMLQESGIEAADAKALLFDAVQAGDITKIDKAALVAKVGENAANIILSGTSTFITESKTKTDAIIADVHAAAGGEDSWGKVADWAAKNVSEEALSEYRPMIDKGGAAARFAVGELVTAYNADAANSSIQPNNPRAEGTSVVNPASTATTRAEYVAALEKAERTGASQKEIATIQAQRNAGRKRGI